MKKILCTARIGAVWLIMLSTFNWGFAQCKLSYDNYYPIFTEEFNYTFSGPSGINGFYAFTNNDFNDRWVLGDPCDAQGAIERSYYDPNQVTITSGPLPETDGYILRLTAEKLTTPITSCIDANSPNEHLWKSGRIETNPLCTLVDNNNHIDWGQGPGVGIGEGWAYGIFEIKCKLPNDPNTPNVWDVWPAFWLISATTEIDLIDATKSNPDELLECGMIDWGHYPDVSPWWSEVSQCNPASYNPYNPLQAYSVPTAANNYNIVSYNGKCYQPNIAYIPQTNCGRRAKKIGGSNLSSAYHVYSVVWTPEAVTFFLNGREIMTIPSSRVETTNYPAKIIAELQMYGGPDSPGPFYMDIDWIKVWKPNGYPSTGGGDPTTYTQTYPIASDYYQSTTEYINHNIHEEGVFNPTTAGAIGVHPEKGSIAFHPNDPNQVFYRGTDNRIYKATYNGSDWSVERLEYNYPNPPMPAVLVGGALNFISGPGQNIITYVGQDGRLQFFGYNNGWYHWWLDDDFSSTAALASFKTSSEIVNVNISSVSINIDNDIFYKGYDRKLHKFHHDGADWIHSVIGQGIGNERVYGDILTASSGTRNVFYTGYDNRLQEFWKDASGYYHHNWIDNPSNLTTHKVKPLSGSMVLKNDYEIVYIGQDHRIQQYSWSWTGTGTEWVHTWVGGQTFVYPSLARPRNGIEWNDTGGNNAIVYGGEDGRIQCLKNNGGTWSHSWINDYTNTTIYNSFPSLTTITIGAKSPDIKINSDGKIFYIGSFDNKGVSKNHLRYFNMESCQEIETVCEYVEATYGTLKNALLNTQNHENKSEDLVAKIYPNPTDNKLSIEIQGADFKSNINTAIIFNIAGQVLLEKALTSEINELDISDFPAGVYFIQITNGEKSLTEKIIKR